MNAAGSPFVLEHATDFSRSLLWQLQRTYFTERGIDAWRQSEVPHYVTSNPTIANCYAELVLAFRRDRERIGRRGLFDREPLHICELGCGSGRFAFYFLRSLERLCESAGVKPTAFRYILTDVSAGNLDFCRRHPSLAPFFADGRLDVAPFDADQPGDLTLQSSGRTIARHGLRQPLVVIANYLFDSVPQDLFHFADGRCNRSLISLTIDERPDGLDAAQLLANLAIHYSDEAAADPPYPEPALQRLVRDYQGALHDAYVLFPATGLRCLEHMAHLSEQGLFVLTADKGVHRLEALEGMGPPSPVRHGSLSLPVNYHAFVRYCDNRGGLALTPESHAQSINVIGLLMTGDAAAHTETQDAYRRHVLDFGPDRFFTITKHARPTIPQMTVEDILAYLELSRYDSHQFGRYLPRLQQLAAEFSAAERKDVIAAIERVWAQYFPLGEKLDLANQIATLLYALDDYAGALTYFARSNEIYGDDAGTLYNMAACHKLLGQDQQTTELLHKVLAQDPQSAEATAMLAEIATPALPPSQNSGL